MYICTEKYTNMLLDINQDPKTLVIMTAEDLAQFARKIISECSKNDPDKVVYSQKEFAKLKNVTVGTLIRWEKEGLVKPTRIGKKVYYRECDFNKDLC